MKIDLRPLRDFKELRGRPVKACFFKCMFNLLLYLLSESPGVAVNFYL